MKLTAAIASATLTITLLSTGCNRTSGDAVIWIGNADLPEYNDVVADVSNAFASDPLCHGIRIETHDYPKGSYWFLETYSTDATGSGPHEFTDGISWWMVHEDHDKDMARYDGSDATSAKAAHHVCFIIKGRGGEVH
ncbi:MAG: hypothetical protein ACLQM6_05980 [Acidobacteriaceae bacterium]